MAFKKGQSGNPAGRPKGSGRVEKARLWYEKYGVDFLIAVAEGKKNLDVTASGKPCKPGLAHRLAATKELGDRGLGKPAQAVDVTSGGESINRMVLVFPEPAK